MEEIKIDIQELTIKCNLPVLEPKKFEETWILVWDERFLPSFSLSKTWRFYNMGYKFTNGTYEIPNQMISFIWMKY